MKSLNIASLDDLIKKAVHESFQETLASRISENAKEIKRQEALRKDINGENTRDKSPEDKKPKDDSRPITSGSIPEADKDTLNPKSMMDQLEKMDDDNKPNISKEKMQIVFPSKEQVIRADIKHILMMLNMLRSGKSLKKTDTRRQLSDYYNTLNSGEKQALFAIISGLTQILAAGVPGRSAVDPSYISLGISPTPTDKKPEETTTATTSKEQTQEDDIFRVSAPNNIPKKTSKSLTAKPKKSDDTPIVVGEVADKEMIKKIYESLRKG
jgi:hypothetical protein